MLYIAIAILGNFEHVLQKTLECWVSNLPQLFNDAFHTHNGLKGRRDLPLYSGTSCF